MDSIDLIVDIMQNHGISEDAIRGVEIATRTTLGGSEIGYVAKVGRVQRERRNERIRSEFDGRNHRELAARFGMTRRNVYNIVR